MTLPVSFPILYAFYHNVENSIPYIGNTQKIVHFGNMMVTIFHTHTYIHTEQFVKTTFLAQGDLNDQLKN